MNGLSSRSALRTRQSGYGHTPITSRPEPSRERLVTKISSLQLPVVPDIQPSKPNPIKELQDTTQHLQNIIDTLSPYISILSYHKNIDLGKSYLLIRESTLCGKIVLHEPAQYNLKNTVLTLRIHPAPKILIITAHWYNDNNGGPIECSYINDTISITLPPDLNCLSTIFFG